MDGLPFFKTNFFDNPTVFSVYLIKISCHYLKGIDLIN